MVARVLVPWLPPWRNRITSPPTGDHEGNKYRTHPLPAALAPTDRPASCLNSRLRVMLMRADQSAVIRITLTKWWWIFRRGEGG